MPPGGETFQFYSAFRQNRTVYSGGMNASPTVKTIVFGNLKHTSFFH